MFFFRIFFLFIFCFTAFTSYSEEFFFKKVKFYGLNNYSENFILNNIFSNSPIRDSNSLINKLSDLNLFDKVEVFWTDDEIKIFCNEKPVINNINVYLDSDKDYIYSLLSKLSLCRGGSYDFNMLLNFRKLIEDFYFYSGFLECSVDFLVEFNPYLNSVNLDIKVIKNGIRHIESIDLIGVNIFNEKKLLTLFSYSSGNWMSWFLKDNLFYADIVENDLDSLRTYYLDRGYSDFCINFIRIYLSDNSNSVKVVINLYEGDRYTISNINVNSDIVSDSTFSVEFFHIINSFLKPGDFFSRQIILDIKNNLKDLFYKYNYIDFDLNFMVFYLGEGKLKADFSVVKQPKSRIKYINFIGNFFTCDNVLRRMIPIFEGSTLYFDRVEFGRDEILRNGVSDYVNIEYIRDPSNSNEIDIIYFIEEQKFGKLTAGLSYGNDDGFSVNFSSEIINFLGIGTDLSLDINNNGIESDFSFNYYTPYFLGNNFGIGYNIYYKSDLLDQDVDDFDILSETFGAYLYYSFDLGKFEKLNFGFGCDMTFLGMYDETSSNEIRSFVEKMGFDFKEYFFNLVWTYNSLDKLSSPTSGFYQNFNFRFNIPFSKSKYYTVNYDINYYNNFYDDYVFNLSSNIYYGNVYNIYETYPFFKNFHIKGITNIRGFKDRSLGPQDSNEDSIGGNLLLCSKLSLFIPNFFPDEFKDIKTSFFIDIGNVYNTSSFSNEDFRSKFYYYVTSIKFSCGVSLLWSTPFGLPLEVSLAYPFNVDDEETKSIISISFG